MARYSIREFVERTAQQDRGAGFVRDGERPRARGEPPSPLPFGKGISRKIHRFDRFVLGVERKHMRRAFKFASAAVR